MSQLRFRLFLLLPALACTACDGGGKEFVADCPPALARSAVAAGNMGAFAGECFRTPPPAPEPPPPPPPPPAEPPPPPPPPPPPAEPEEPELPDSALGSASARKSALVGTFYDLKLTSDGRKTRLYPLTGDAFDEELARTYHDIISNWSPEVLERFYKSPTQLFASNFYLPMCDARYGPHAYKCDTDKIKHRGWVVVYRGKVRAPISGRFRFVGTGDDFICVRFNNKLVLEAGFVLPTMYNPARPNKSTYLSAFHPEGRRYIERIKAGKESRHPGYEYTRLPSGWGWNMVGGLTHGLSFEVKEGESYPIEIMISEGPGDAFGFALFTEDMTRNPQSGKPDAERVFDLFRTDATLPDIEQIKSQLREADCLRKGGLECPRYNTDSPIWKVVP